MLIELGDHLVSTRFGYTHHGIYIGNNQVIHYSGLSNGISSGPIKMVSLNVFEQGRGYTVRKHSNRKFNRYESVSRAKSRLGEDGYCVFSNNCEHFVNWCIDGNHNSSQVDSGATVFSGAATGTVGVASTAAVSATGSVVGVSGSGVMSGLATIGGTVGGGAVAGIGLLGGVSGLASATIINNTVLKDNVNLSKEERNSRAAGRAASYGGAAVGTAGGVAAVSMMGTAGLSAVGITSGLAAIGGTVGGGMVAGVAMTAAAPVVAAAALGVGIYKAFKWFTK